MFESPVFPINQFKKTHQTGAPSPGPDALPRPVVTSRLEVESASTQKTIDSLSLEARKILERCPKYMHHVVVGPEARNENGRILDAVWNRTGRRARHSSAIATILNLAIMRRDYPLASQAFALLVRIPHVEIRVIWGIGLELLSWRCEQKAAKLSEESDDEASEVDPNLLCRQFLDWLITSFPYNARSKKMVWKNLPRSLELYPYLILTLLLHNRQVEALERLENLLLQAPYSDEPFLHALRGMAFLLEANSEYRNDAEKLKKCAGECFEKAKAWADHFRRNYSTRRSHARFVSLKTGLGKCARTSETAEHGL